MILIALMNIAMSFVSIPEPPTDRIDYDEYLLSLNFLTEGSIPVALTYGTSRVISTDL